MTLTLTPEMEALVNKQLATGQFTTQEEVVRAALMQFESQYDELKADIAKGMEDIKHGRVAPLDVAATLAREQAKHAANAGAEPCES